MDADQQVYSPEGKRLEDTAVWPKRKKKKLYLETSASTRVFTQLSWSKATSQYAQALFRAYIIFFSALFINKNSLRKSFLDVQNMMAGEKKKMEQS